VINCDESPTLYSRPVWPRRLLIATRRKLVICLTPALLGVLFVIRSRQIDSRDRPSAWLLTACALLVGVLTACVLYRLYSSLGITEAPEPRHWPVILAVASVPVWESYVRPLTSMLLIGGFGSFLVTLAWLYREQAES
jgi:hypothetical protein